MRRSVVCGELGSAEGERWSVPWSCAPEDASRLDWLRSQGILDVEHQAHGAVRVAGRNFCGRIRLPSGTTIDISSKVPLLPLIEWLAFTDTLPELHEWSDSPTLGPEGTLVNALASFFIHELAHLTRFHWRHGHEAAPTLTVDFRGHLDVRRFARTSSRLPALPCVFRKRTLNTPPNGVLARALDATWLLVDRSALPEVTRRKLDWLTVQWTDIERSTHDLPQAMAEALNSPPIGYRRTLRLARLILLGSMIDPAGGDGGNIFLVKMSAVWEEGLRRMLASWAGGHGLVVGDTHERTRPWEDATVMGEPNRWLTVDALLKSSSPIVFDAKYKRDFGDESRGDRFQMAAYAMGFGASAAVLVYPTAETEPRQRRLMRSALPGVASDIFSIELPMALGPRACAEAAAKVLPTLLGQD
jgi:5-methylcytosine-specific restriction endonuclease McrBC regulatory subunit McrC